MKISNGLKKLLRAGQDTAGSGLEHLGVTMDIVASDIKSLGKDARKNVEELLDAWAGDKILYAWFEEFLETSEKGWDATVVYLKARKKELNTYLAKEVRLNPYLVGGVDGFFQVYLATRTERWTRSPRYRKGVKTGRLIGILCAFTIFLPVSVGRALIGLLPGASRLVRYIAKTWDKAGRQSS